MALVLSRAWDKEKILRSNEESNLRPSDLRLDARPLSHRDSTVREVYYEVHMTRVLHTARISSVDSVMFVDRNGRDGKLNRCKHMRSLSSDRYQSYHLNVIFLTTS